MSGQKCPIPITPETKLAALLDSYPQLEPVLVEMSPEFAKLRNPVLRRTLARVATLRQVAALGKKPLAELINGLRRAAGIDTGFESTESAGEGSKTPPAWFDPSRIVKTLDARPLLEAGEHPVQRVLSDCKSLKPGEIYELLTPFAPLPLIDAATNQGLRTWSGSDPDGIVRTYFTTGA